MVQFIDNYDDMTVPEVQEYLDENDLTVDQLETLQEYEQAHEDRTGVKDALNEDLDELTPVPEDSDGDNDSDVGDLTPDAGASDAPDEVLVELHDSYNRLYAAGVWFDSPAERKAVDYTPRIEEAVEDGQLRIVSDT